MGLFDLKDSCFSTRIILFIINNACLEQQSNPNITLRCNMMLTPQSNTVTKSVCDFYSNILLSLTVLFVNLEVIYSDENKRTNKKQWDWKWEGGL